MLHLLKKSQKRQGSCHLLSSMVSLHLPTVLPEEIHGRLLFHLISLYSVQAHVKHYHHKYSGGWLVWRVFNEEPLCINYPYQPLGKPGPVSFNIPILCTSPCEALSSQIQHPGRSRHARRKSCFNIGTSGSLELSNEELELKVERRLSKGVPADLGAGWFEGWSVLHFPRQELNAIA